MQILKYPMITTSFNYEYIPTQPMALRPMLKKNAMIQKLIRKGEVSHGVRRPSDLDASKIFPNYKAREKLGFPKYRQFDDFQVVLYKDSLYLPGTIDKVTLFGLRCPELRWVKRLPKYFIYFHCESWDNYEKAKTTIDQSKLLIKCLTIDLYKCPWIDSMGRITKVRMKSVEKLSNILTSYPNEYIREDFGTYDNYLRMNNLFLQLRNEMQLMISNSNREMTPFFARFVYESKGVPEKLPIYWFRTTRANQFENFTYHLLLSLGQFNTELELMSCGNLKQAFIKARLFTQSKNKAEKETSCNNLIRKYITSQLCHIPAGSPTFDRELVSAYDLLTNFLLNDVIITNSLPSTLYTNMKKQCSEEIETHLSNVKLKLLNGTMFKLNAIYPKKTLPSASQLKIASKANPSAFKLSSLPKPQQQSDESFEEHQETYQLIENLIEHYKSGTFERTKSLCLLGAGGVGKTTIMHLACLYGMAQGLTVLSTTLTGKRSAENAGLHIHVLFMMPTDDGLSTVQTAEKSLKTLLLNPKEWETLRRVDIMLVDELGQVDARLLNILDMIMRRVRHSTTFFGGVPLISTMDTKQLRPIHGLPPLMSPSMMCSFVYKTLTKVLRTVDEDMQELQMISRMTPEQLMGDRKKLYRRFRYLLKKTCNFVKSFDDDLIPVNAIYCYSKNSACQKAEREIVTMFRKRYRNRVLKRESDDYEETRLQKLPQPASKSTRNLLDKHSNKLPRYLWFFPYATYEFTHNHSSRLYMKSQICMFLNKIPTQQQINKWEEIEVYAAPCGVTCSPKEHPTENELLKAGWNKIKVGLHPDRAVKLKHNGLSGKRIQYAIRPHVSSTIHGIMGSTVENLVVKVSTDEEHSLWEPAQVVVILSRTRQSKHLFFIGTLDETTRALWNALTTKDQYTDYINYLEKKLSDQTCDTNFQVHQSTMHPFRSKDLPLCAEGERCVYLLISTKNIDVTYIGWTSNLARRINQHNSTSGGAIVTNDDTLKPFCYGGYVAGFDSDKSARSFERSWQEEVEQEQRRKKGHVNWEQILFLARIVSAKHKKNYNDKLILFVIDETEYKLDI